MKIQDNGQLFCKTQKISWDMRYVDIDKISQKIFLTENEADKFIGDL